MEVIKYHVRSSGGVFDEHMGEFVREWRRKTGGGYLVRTQGLMIQLLSWRKAAIWKGEVNLH